MVISLTLGTALLAQPRDGQIIVDPEHPTWLMRKGGDHVFFCGPGDPEGFLYRGKRKHDGTRDGDQEALIRKLIANGGNCIYMQAVRSHGGDGLRDHNPFVDSDPKKGIDPDILEQWESWFSLMDAHGILIYFFFFDDSARLWGKKDEPQVPDEERAFIKAIVERFQHHDHLIWIVAEEAEEAFSPGRIRAMAEVIRQADKRKHIVGCHHQSGTRFKAWKAGSALSHYSLQLNFAGLEAHDGAVKALREAAGRYQVIYAESTAAKPDARHAWASAMGGLMPMLLEMDIATTPVAELRRCRHLQKFFEAGDFYRLSPHDELAHGGTQWVLADGNGTSYIAYAEDLGGPMGVKGMQAGEYALSWLDCATGRLVMQTVTADSGKQSFAKPAAIESWCALRIKRTRTLSTDWPQFRGPNSSGQSTSASTPVEFGPGKNELWHVPLDSGHSSPCVVSNSIFLTTFDKKAKKLEVLCIARAGGEIRWRRTVPIENIEKGHPSFNPASSTTASDGERVVAYFGSFGLICFDMDGTKLWEIKMPLAKSYSGNATSPIIVGDRVILYRGNYVDHFLLAVDKQTGKEIWKKQLLERVTIDMACAATPIVAGKNLIVHSARAIQSYELSSGKLIWQTRASTTATSTPVLAGDEVIVATWNQTGEPSLVPVFPTYETLLEENDKDGDGLISKEELPRLMYFHRSEGTEAPENGAPLRFSHCDQDKSGTIDAGEWKKVQEKSADRREKIVPHGLLAIKIDSKETIDPEKIRTLETKGIPEVPSPIYHEGYIYFVKNGGILTCVEAKSGKRIYRMRTRGRGTHYASPIIADGKLYSTAGDGRISVLSLGPKPAILATNDLTERTYATPAIVDGTIYVRTHETLFAFGLKK